MNFCLVHTICSYPGRRPTAILDLVGMMTRSFPNDKLVTCLPSLIISCPEGLLGSKACFALRVWPFVDNNRHALIHH
jgi:hypothetical protein